MTRNVTRTAVALAGLLAAVASQAAVVPVLNAGFEAPLVPTVGGWIKNDVQGWTLGGTGAAGVFRPVAGYVPEGSQAGYAELGRSLSQTLTTTLQAGTTYSLDVMVGRKVGSAAPVYTIELLAGGTVLGSVDSSQVAPGEGQFVTANVTYTASASDALLGEALGLRLLSGAASKVHFDQVDLLIHTPLPPALPLLGAALIGLSVFSRRLSRSGRG